LGHILELVRYVHVEQVVVRESNGNLNHPGQSIGKYEKASCSPGWARSVFVAGHESLLLVQLFSFDDKSSDFAGLHA